MNQPISCHITSVLCCPGAPLSMPTTYKSDFAAANHEMPVPLLRVLPLGAPKATASWSGEHCCLFLKFLNFVEE